MRGFQRAGTHGASKYVYEYAPGNRPAEHVLQVVQSEENVFTQLLAGEGEKSKTQIQRGTHGRSS